MFASNMKSRGHCQPGIVVMLVGLSMSAVHVRPALGGPTAGWKYVMRIHVKLAASAIAMATWSGSSVQLNTALAVRS